MALRFIRSSSHVLVALFLAVSRPIFAQEPPAFDMTPFTNDTHRTKLCPINQAIIAGDVELKYALQGLALSVGVVDHSVDSFMKFNPLGGLDTEHPGLFPNILDELARRAGFTWRNSYGQVFPPHHPLNEGRQINGNPITWTDILVDAVERYDFTFAEWVHNLHRRQLGVGFPAPWFDASTILVQASRETQPRFSIISFLKPFSYEVWGMIFALIVFSAVIYWKMDVLISSRFRRITGADLFFPAMAFTQHHIEWNPSTHSQRIFSFSLSFWALIMGAAYTANMASFLVAPDQPAFTEITLKQATEQGVKVCARGGAAVENQLKGAYPGLKIVSGEGFTDTYLKLRNRECLVMATRASDWSKYQRDSEVNPDCSLQWIGRAEVTNGGGAACKIDIGNYCTSLVMHVLDIHFNEMLADGFIDEIWQKHVDSLATNNCVEGASNEEDTASTNFDKSLRPVDVGGIFLIHGIASLIAIGFAFFEARVRDKSELKSVQETLPTSDNVRSYKMQQYVVQRRRMPEESREAATDSEVSKRNIFSNFNKATRNLNNGSFTSVQEMAAGTRRLNINDLEEGSSVHSRQTIGGNCIVTEQLVHDAMASMKALQEHLDLQKKTNTGNHSVLMG